MATVTENLTTAKENLAAKLAELTASPKPSYSIEGQSISWGEYYSMLTAQMKAINELLNQEATPLEVRTQAVT